MALAIPKKKKIIRILIIILNLVDIDLDNEIEGTVFETLSSLMAQADALLFNVPENEWDSDHQAAWNALEAIHDAIQPDAPNEPNYQALVATFENKLAAL